MSDLEAVPNPVIHSCQILDPGRDVRRIEVIIRGAQAGPADGLQPLDDRRRRQTEPRPRAHRGPGHQHRHSARGPAEDGDRPARDRRLPDLPPLWQVFGGARRPDGRWALPELSAEVASPDAALHIGPQFVILETAAIDAGARRRRHRPAAGHVVARDVPGPGQGRPVPGRGAADRRRRRAVAVRAAAARRGQRATRRSPPGRTLSTTDPTTGRGSRPAAACTARTPYMCPCAGRGCTERR